MNKIIQAIENEKWAIDEHALAPMPSEAHNASIDRIAKAVKELEAPGGGGEFERVFVEVTDDFIENQGRECGLRDGELQTYWEGGEWVRDYLKKRLTAAHAADLRSAEERHKKEVCELVEALEYADKYLDSPHIRALIERHKGGES
ncbi:MAG: hypothetical protein HGB02_08475 [Chlorobiaceae bacterium]|nr:hypothetical protein [Chlorobiaceae bacterium]